MLGRSGAQIRRLDDEAFRYVTAFAQPVKNNEIANEIAIRGRFKHGRWKRSVCSCTEFRDRNRALLARARTNRCRNRPVCLAEMRGRKAKRVRSVQAMVPARSVAASARR